MTFLLGLKDRKVTLSYMFPIVSGILITLSFPPFNIWYLGFVALVPHALFLIWERSQVRIFIGGALFGIIFSGYVSLAILPSFAWLPQAHLFRDFMHFLPLPIMLCTAVWAGAASVLLSYLERNISFPFGRVLLFGGLLTVNEWIISSLSFGFNYGSFAYIGVHLALLREALSIGGPLFVSFLIFFCNAAFAEIIFVLVKKDRRRWFVSLIPLLFMGICFIAIIGFVQFKQNTNFANKESATRSMSIAIIQDKEQATQHTFGEVRDGIFRFNRLEQDLIAAEKYNPEFIVYPFSPWSSAITNETSAQTKEDTTAVDFAIFGRWIKGVIPPETVFVVWGAAFRDGVYSDEIEFWKNGELIGFYQKRKPFAFMDYTPQWAAHLGFYSTPLDITAGTSSEPLLVDSVPVGGLVCSEITDSSIARENARGARILFSIGTEMILTGPTVGTFNLLNAQLRAAETGRAVIRANAFGPSAIIDGRGSIVTEMPYGEEGVLFGIVQVSTGR